MSTIRAIEIPKWGMTMDEGTVDEWHLDEGDSFVEGDLLVAIESTKVMNDLAASFDGTLRRIVAHSGDVLPVGALIGVSADPSVPDEEIDAFIAERAQPAGGDEEPEEDAAASAPAPAAAAPAAAPAVTPSSATPAPAAAAAPVSAPAAAGPAEVAVPASLRGTTADDVFATPHARAFAAEHGIDLGAVTGSGRAGRVSLADVESAVTAAGGSVPAKTAVVRSGTPLRSTADDAQVDATPVARRLAAGYGVNLHDCRATGREGRVTVPDVEEAARRFGLGNGAPGAESPATASAASATGAATANTPEAVPFTGMRRAIATRLQQSTQTSPHFRVNQEVQIDALLALRKQVNDTVPGVKISVNDLVVKAVATALVRVPEVNVQFDEASQTVLRFPHADVSVAVSVPDGLITPIVRDADTKSLSQISADVRDLAIKAKAGNLQPDEFQGGTFTVSNLGMYGVSSFDAVINPPQAAILAVGAGVQKPVILADGSVEPRTVLTVSIAADHRVIDGALAATFVGELKGILEQPAQMLV